MTKIQIETRPDCIETRPPIDEASPEWQTMHGAGLNGITTIICRGDRTILAYSPLKATQLEGDASKLAQAFRDAGTLVELNPEPSCEAPTPPPAATRRRWGKLALKLH